MKADDKAQYVEAYQMAQGAMSELKSAVVNLLLFGPSDGLSNVEICNVLGQRIVTLVNANYEAGEHVVQWDGRDAVGSAVSSGIYFYRLTAGTAVTSKKMMLLK